MKNSVKDIGKKIKALRIEKNLTQSELCGTKITRNHLSIIESGKSLPSLSTLCYIAERLDIPVGYFFSEDEQAEAKFANLFTIDDAKQAFISKSYSKCVQIGDMIPASLRSAEMSQLLSLSHFSIAISYAQKFEISAAIRHLRASAEAAQRSCYLSSDFLSAISYYELLFTNLTQKDIPKRLTDIREASSYVPVELILYFSMLSKDSFNINDTSFTKSEHRKHAEALAAKCKGDYNTSFTILKELSEAQTIPYYMMYHVLDDLEQCADSISEFRTAYIAAKQKMELMNK